jgi:dUTP pyrophosphatase
LKVGVEMAAAKSTAVKIKVKHSGRYPLPAYATSGSAAMDLHAEISRSQHIIQGESELIPTGLWLSIPKGYCAKIFSRSGLANKKGLGVASGVGVIDSDYRGQVYVSLMNFSDVTRYIEPGDRIAQIMVEKIETIAWQPVDELDETDRGIGGFGSSGDKTIT